MTTPESPHVQASLPVRRSRTGSALFTALLLHALLCWWLVVQHDAIMIASDTAAPPMPPRKRGGGGGGGPGVVYISPPRAAPAPTPAVPVPVLAPVVVRVVPKPTPTPPPVATLPPPQPVPSAPLAAAPSTGVGTGTGSGSGTGTGSGTGSGHGSGTGAGNGPGVDSGAVVIIPPVWRSGALPLESPPSALRGKTVAVTFTVTPDGKVDRYEVVPAITDGTYARIFGEVMRDFRFIPAHTVAGAKVTATTTLSFTLPTRS